MKMNKEDYFKYYIQGSDHYLIPKDVFDELFDEMVNWRKESKELNQKYLNAVVDYETTMFEKEQLNSLVNSCQEEIRRLKKQLEENKDKINWYENFEINKTIDKLRIKHNNQQKEFIDYLEDKIYSIEPKGTGIIYNCEYDGEEDYVMAMQEQSRLNTLKNILQKYKEIIGNDINVGSIGGKE